MKNFKIFGLITAFVVFLAGDSYAQNAGNGKMSYVNLSRIFDEYGKTKEYDAALEKKHNAYEQEHKDKLQKIKDAEGKLALLKEDEKNKLKGQIDKDQNDLVAFDRQKQTDLKRERDEKIREILGDIEKVVKDYAQKENYALILNDRVLIYGQETLDITNQVIKLLNDKNAPPAGK